MLEMNIAVDLIVQVVGTDAEFAGDGYIQERS